MNRRELGAFVATLSLAVACKKTGGSGTLKIAVVPKGTTHEFWKAVHAGAEKAAKEAGVEIVWKGPLKEDDLKAQIDVVQTFTAQGVNGIVLAPLSDKALVGSVKAAVGQGIPVVIFDSDLAGSDHASFVATDNRAAGRLAGEHLVKVLGGKGKVVVLRYQEGSASTAHREDGFLEYVRGEAVKKAPELQLVSTNQYGGATTESALAKAESLLAAQNAGAGGVDGVFTPNESTTFGMLLALQRTGLAGKVKPIGFDASDKLVEALRRGEIEGLVVQDPFKIGYLSVKTMAAHLRKEPVDKRIDTGAKLVTKANVDTAEIQALLHP
ncbi:MAG: substrate-binding domain-containing protein [Deltaproteobacteria bacterium]|nr:substrate-binding domain-containing protein [Deltaproteobacteria bacterium]